uniref:uncharacterized protein n=1 Tax=Pristiophorus japonicus TaxID=55135 RepID=UPI00398F5C75
MKDGGETETDGWGLDNRERKNIITAFFIYIYLKNDSVCLRSRCVREEGREGVSSRLTPGRAAAAGTGRFLRRALREGRSVFCCTGRPLHAPPRRCSRLPPRWAFIGLLPTPELTPLHAPPTLPYKIKYYNNHDTDPYDWRDDTGHNRSRGKVEKWEQQHDSRTSSIINGFEKRRCTEDTGRGESPLETLLCYSKSPTSGIHLYEERGDYTAKGAEEIYKNVA